MLRLAAALGLLLGLSGCFSTTVDELYCPPKMPKDYVQLDARIGALREELGAEYASPKTGGTPPRYSSRTWTGTDRPSLWSPSCAPAPGSCP